MIRQLGFILFVFLPLALAGCARDPIDSAGEGNGVDPAVASALQDQIMVDPALGQQANGDAVRPPGQPYSAGVPADGVAAGGGGNDGDLMRAPDPVQSAGGCQQCSSARDAATLGGLAERQKAGGMGGCAASIEYSATWAQRLPADIPLYPQARVTEAAGSNNGKCALRAVSFSSPAPMQTMLDWYYTKAVRAGYTAEHQADGNEHVLGGTRDRDGGAYVLFMTPRQDGGTDIDLVANNGV
ncbi:hypothetical protein ACFQ1E_10635 [Sphingomonas canadensis]|uniref:Uncharacterized protein n=1 Tax=Sphingomonas canadensis TaxID=1219257 RepID=A0ABW3HBV4_9SPHN|nr:hypothetical protein [Sphingomonas canadensis]MCW3836425.1 hypothetical protein [Sphingomonas canadensis]